MNTMFQDKPAVFPKHCPDGRPMKPLTQVLLDRRATSHFKPEPVPQEYLESILQFAAQAPSGYNLQPWRFIVVREKGNRERLKKAAYNQEKISEAPVVIIAFAMKDDWKNYIDVIFDEGVRRGCGKSESVLAIKKQAGDFLEKGIYPSVWLNRHTMIAMTTMMLMAEALWFGHRADGRFRSAGRGTRIWFAGKRGSYRAACHRIWSGAGQTLRRTAGTLGNRVR